MMNVIFTLLANRAFSSGIEGVNSKKVSLASLALLKPLFFRMNTAINL